MGKRLHTKEIVEGIIAVLDIAALQAAPPTGLGIKHVQFGAIEFLSAAVKIADIMPIIFIKPINAAPENRIAITKLTIPHNFRIVFIRRFGDDEEIIKQKAIDAELIFDTLMDAHLLPGITTFENDWQVIDSLVDDVDYEPPEDALVFSSSADISATAMNFLVKTTGRRK